MYLLGKLACRSINLVVWARTAFTPISRGVITVTALCSLSAAIRSFNKGCVQAQLPTLVDDTVRLETDTRPRITLSALNQRPGQQSVLVLPTVVLTTYPYLFQCAQGH